MASPRCLQWLHGDQVRTMSIDTAGLPYKSGGVWCGLLMALTVAMLFDWWMAWCMDGCKMHAFVERVCWIASVCRTYVQWKIKSFLWVTAGFSKPRWSINSLRPRQNGSHFSDDIFKSILLSKMHELRCMITISLRFVPKGPSDNIPTLVQIMAYHRPGDKTLSEPMMVNLGVCTSSFRKFILGLYAFFSDASGTLISHNRQWSITLITPTDH